MEPELNLNERSLDVLKDSEVHPLDHIDDPKTYSSIFEQSSKLDENLPKKNGAKNWSLLAR